MHQSNLSIGALSALTHCNVPTIRYYEQIGLIPHAQRAENGHRFYQDVDLRRLAFIKRCRDFGFSIEQVRELTQLFEDGDRACVEVRDLAQVHLNEVRGKLAEMRQLEISLAVFVDSCSSGCSDGSTKNCTIIEDLSATSEKPSGSCSPISAQGIDIKSVNLKRKK
jgi:DNA-binding transcriptional MerR regulator